MARKLKKRTALKEQRSIEKKADKASSTKRTRYVYFFGDGKADGNGSMKASLGGKGANLHEMTRIGLPVPPGFTINTEVCTYFYDNKKAYPPELKDQVASALGKIEKSVGKKLGDRKDPLLLSVRSGARDSMPGMMDTILNLGMNDEVVEVFAGKSGNPPFAWDSHPLFLRMYADVRIGEPQQDGPSHAPFQTVI